MSEELYKKYRPTSFKDVVGQEAAIKSLTDMGKRGQVPHTILFTGPSGCGKTTLARILRQKLKCSDNDFLEINASENTGIDFVRSLKQKIGMAPISGPCRIFMFDECHQFSANAQDGLLKILEDTPEHVYFFLCTTDPQKLKKTVVTRCTEVKVQSLQAKDAFVLVDQIAEKEGTSISEDVKEALFDACEGSARKLLVLLHSVIGLSSENAQIDAIAQSSGTSSASTDLAKALLKARNFTEVAPVLKALRAASEDAEKVRRGVLGYHTAILLNSPGNTKCARVIDLFSDNTYDCGFPGIVRMVYQLFQEE